MADKHPYTSGTAGLTQAVAQLRRSFPSVFGADTLKKLGIAPNNETYVLNILRFLGILDVDGKKGPNVGSVFNQHEDADFQAGFSDIVRSGYAELFNLHGEDAWALPTAKLIAYFRHTDGTSEIVGKRQASTFQALGMLSGKIDGASRSASATPKARKSDTSTAKPARTKTKSATSDSTENPVQLPIQAPGNNSSNSQGSNTNGGMALTVRVEINLPANGDQETYDRIFKSIRENLLNGHIA